MRASHLEHDELIDAILAQDGPRAARAMQEHAAHSALNALQHFIDEQPASERLRA
jgi:DNA-binding GntR family transcriptional regulator